MSLCSQLLRVTGNKKKSPPPGRELGTSGFDSQDFRSALEEEMLYEEGSKPLFNFSPLRASLRCGLYCSTHIALHSGLSPVLRVLIIHIFPIYIQLYFLLRLRVAILGLVKTSFKNMPTAKAHPSRAHRNSRMRMVCLESID